MCICFDESERTSVHLFVSAQINQGCNCVIGFPNCNF